jgi:hypothetical protein
VACEPPHRLGVIARARPLAVTEVDITLDAEGSGTRIVMVERLTGGLAAAVRGRPGDALMHLRNREAVRRLGWLAEIGRHLAVSAAQAAA